MLTFFMNQMTPRIIELLALDVNLDDVDAFIGKTSYFEMLDRAVKGPLS